MRELFKSMELILKSFQTQINGDYNSIKVFTRYVTVKSAIAIHADLIILK